MGMITVKLVSKFNKTKKENMWLLVCSETVESKLVKLDTSRRVYNSHNGECSLPAEKLSNGPALKISSN